MALTSKHLHDALRTVQDPDLKKDLVTLGMVKDVVQSGNDVRLVIELTTPACPMKDKIREDIDGAVRAKAIETGEPLGKLEIEFTADVRTANERTREGANPLPMVKNIIAVGAGKGGVGKSTVSANLAVGLARFGAKVGLLDGDIYGPSVPTLLGLADIPTAARGNMLLPFEVHGIKAMTLGKLVEPEKALVWRGPMAHGAFKQLATQTDWGALDYLIIDLPPGTGDVPLTMSQLLPLTGAVVVCTPQDVALLDATKAIAMFRKVNIPLLGMVENMSFFVCPDTQKRYDIFGTGGAKRTAKDLDIPFLGEVPIQIPIREHGDSGRTAANYDDPAARPYLEAICTRLVGNLAAAHATRPPMPSLPVL